MPTHSAAKHPYTTHPQAHKPVETCYHNHPFAADEEHLPVGFCGVDILRLSLYTDSSPLLGDRIEFETSDAYNARRASFQTSPLVPGLKPSDRMAFVLKQEAQNWKAPVGVDYDAAAQQFKVAVHVGLLSAREQVGTQSYGTISVKEIQVAERKYIASNAMGVRVRVDDTSYRDFGIAFRPGRSIYPSYVTDPTFDIPVPASEARQVKGVLQSP